MIMALQKLADLRCFAARRSAQIEHIMMWLDVQQDRRNKRNRFLEEIDLVRLTWQMIGRASAHTCLDMKPFSLSLIRKLCRLSSFSELRISVLDRFNW